MQAIRAAYLYRVQNVPRFLRIRESASDYVEESNWSQSEILEPSLPKSIFSRTSSTGLRHSTRAYGKRELTVL